MTSDGVVVMSEQAGTLMAIPVESRPPDLHLVLQDEMKTRQWGVPQLSKAVGVHYPVAARWVAADEAHRVVPLPRHLVRLSEVLERDPIELFRHAGYLPVAEVFDREAPSPPEIARRLRRLERMLTNLPEAYTALALAVADGQLDALQATLHRLIELEL